MCETSFEPRRVGAPQRYCSKRCRIKAANGRHKAKATEGNGALRIKPVHSGTRTLEPLPDHIERPLSVRIEEPDWLKDDLRPPPAGPWEDGAPG